jgi:hypothetical protein
MTGPSFRLDDCDMLEYLDTVDSDSDFILESDIDDAIQVRKKMVSYMPHPQLLTLWSRWHGWWRL